MPTVINSWPPWTEYTLDNAWPEAALTKETENPTEKFKRYKKDLVLIYGEEALRKSWLKVCNELESLTREITEKGTTIIPEVGYDELFNMSEDEKREFRKRGCFVVRGVISEEQATKYFEDLKDFIRNNEENITGKSQTIPVKIYVTNTLRLANEQSHDPQPLLVSHPTRHTFTPQPIAPPTRVELMVA